MMTTTERRLQEVAQQEHSFEAIDTKIKAEVERYRSGDPSASDALYYLRRERAALLRR